MTGPFRSSSPSPGHPTSGGDLEYHLPHVKGQGGNEDGSSNRLLQDSSSGEFDEHGSIYAHRSAQEKGMPAEDEASITRASLLPTQAASDREKQARAVSTLKISFDSWMTPLPTSYRNYKKPASAYPLSID